MTRVRTSWRSDRPSPVSALTAVRRRLALAAWRRCWPPPGLPRRRPPHRALDAAAPRAAGRRVGLRRPGCRRPHDARPRPTSCAHRSATAGYRLLHRGAARARPRSDGSSERHAAGAATTRCGIAGTYAVYLGDGPTSAFKGDSTLADVGDQVATVAYRDNKDAGAYAVISAFVTERGARPHRRTAPAARRTSASGGGGRASSRSSRSGPRSSAAAATALSRKAKKANAERTAAVRRTSTRTSRRTARSWRGIDVDDPRLDEAGRADAQRALDSYETGQARAPT